MPVGSTNPGPAIENTINTQSPPSFYRLVQTIAVAITPVSVATITVAEQSYGANGASFATAATGILAGDIILSISPPSITAGVGIAGWRVDTATNDKFYVDWVNPTAGSLTPPSGTYLITVARLIQSITTTPGTFSTLPAAIVTTS
jgi:hypothetical protein